MRPVFTRSKLSIGVGLLSALLIIPSAASADEHEVDGRAHISWVEGVLDQDGQLWFKVGFYRPWADTPPRDIYHLTFSLEVVIGDESKEVGWTTEGGEETFFGDEGTQAFILDNGCVLVGTGLKPTGSYQVEIFTDFASWTNRETTSLVNGHQDMGTSSEFIDQGDPMTVFGVPVFNLTTGQPVDGAGGGLAQPKKSSESSDSGAPSSGDPGTTSDQASDTGGMDLGVVFALVALLTAILYWFFRIRPKRYAYRADREVGLDIVEESARPDPDASANDDERPVPEGEPTEGIFPLVVEEPDTTFEDPCWEQNRKLNDAQDRLRDLEAEQAGTDPSHEETHKALEQAIEQARDNVAAAQRALEDCIEKHREGE